MSNTSKQFTVALSDQSISKLLDREAHIYSQLEADVNFSIRYSVPPDSLNSQVNELSLKRTPRGDYLIEESEDQEKKPVQPVVSKLGKPSFKGPVNENRETDCILVYSEATGQYELRFLDGEIQAAPALKTRKPITKSSSTVASQPVSAAATPTVKSRASSPMHPYAVPSAKSSPSSQVQSVSGSSRSKRTMGLPTRRKISSKVKPIGIDDNESVPILPTLTGSYSDIKVRSKAATPMAYSRPQSTTVPAQRLVSQEITHQREAVSPASFPPVSAPRSPPHLKLHSPQLSSLPTTRSPTPPPDDEDFDDLVDELADDLMEISEDEKKPVNVTLGTAGGSAEDEDSSEEE